MDKWEQIGFAIALAVFVYVLASKQNAPSNAMAVANETALADLPYYLTYNQGFTGLGTETAVPSSNIGVANAPVAAGSAVPSSNGTTGSPCIGCGGAIFNTSGVSQL